MENQKAKRFDIVTPHRTYIFLADNDSELKAWIDGIRAVKIEEANRISKSVDLSSMSSATDAMVGCGVMFLMAQARIVFPQKQGWLTKQGAFVKSWKRRWFVLENAMLFYFERQEDYPLKPKGSVPVVDDCIVRHAQDPDIIRPFCLELWHPNLDSYFASAESEQDEIEWMTALRKTIMALQELKKQVASGGEDGDESSTFMGLKKMGYLMRRDSELIGNTWNKRLFLLKNGFLLCYKDKVSPTLTL